MRLLNYLKQLLNGILTQELCPKRITVSAGEIAVDQSERVAKSKMDREMRMSGARKRDPDR
jgi:hypothetical protein